MAPASAISRSWTAQRSHPTGRRDGTWITFWLEDQAVYVINADGSDLHVVTAPGGQAAFTPDGDHLVYEPQLPRRRWSLPYARRRLRRSGLRLSTNPFPRGGRFLTQSRGSAVPSRRPACWFAKREGESTRWPACVCRGMHARPEFQVRSTHVRHGAGHQVNDGSTPPTRASSTESAAQLDAGIEEGCRRPWEDQQTSRPGGPDPT